MKPFRRSFAVFFALTTLLGLILSYRQHLEIVRLRAKISDPADGLQRQLAIAQDVSKNLRAQLEAMQHSPFPGSQIAESAASKNGTASAQSTEEAKKRALWADPRYQSLRAIELKGFLSDIYGDLFKNLHLSSQQRDQFANLLVQKQQAVSDAFQLAHDKNLDPQGQDYQMLYKQVTAEYDDQIKAVIGDSGFLQFIQFPQSQPQRYAVSALQQSLSYTDTPLTDGQAQQMIQLLQGQGSGSTGTGRSPITDQTITQAAGILSEPQIQALRQLQQRQQAQGEMQRMEAASATPDGEGGK